MTAVSSDNIKLLKNISFAKFGTYFLYKLKQQGAAAALVAIIAFMGFPFCAFSMFMVNSTYETMMEAQQISVENPTAETGAAFDYAYNAYDAWRSIYGIAPYILVLTLIGLFIAEFIIMQGTYRYLSGKRYVDMDYSLPVSDDTRFFGDLLAGLAVVMVPFLAAVITALGIFASIDSGAWYAEQDNGFAEMLKFMPQIMWVVFGAMIMFYVFSLMITACCSRTVEARTVPLAINGFVPLIFVSLFFIVNQSFYGYYSTFDGVSVMPISATSPIGMIIGALMNYTLTAGDESFTMMYPSEWIAAAVMTLIYTAAAYVLFKLRRSERVGTPYAYKGMRHIAPAIVVTGIVCTVLSIRLSTTYEDGLLERTLLSSDSRGWIVAICIITFVIFLVMELVSGKGFKKFGFTLLRYIATLAGGFIVFYGAAFVGCAVEENRIPAANSVDNVVVSYTEVNMNVRCEFKETADIEKAISLHRDFLSNRFDDGGSIVIKYTLKNGKEFYRGYSTANEQQEKTLRLLMENGGLERNYWLDDSYIYDYGNSSMYGEIVPNFESVLKPNVEFISVSVQGKTVGRQPVPLNIDPYEMYKAIILDARDTTYDEYYNNTDKRSNIRLIITYSTQRHGERDSYYDIPACFTRTNELLAQQGISFDVDLNSFGVAVLINTNDYSMKRDYLYKWILSGDYQSAADLYYPRSTVIPLDSVLLSEVYGCATNAPIMCDEGGAPDVEWVLALIYKSDDMQCSPLDRLLYEAGIAASPEDAYSIAEDLPDTYDENGDLIMDEIASLYSEDTLVMRIPSEYNDRMAEIFSSLKN